jgi:hypothetical protein
MLKQAIVLSVVCVLEVEIWCSVEVITNILQEHSASGCMVEDLKTLNMEVLHSSLILGMSYKSAQNHDTERYTLISFLFFFLLLN